MHSIGIYLRANCCHVVLSVSAHLAYTGSIIPFPGTIIGNFKRPSQLTTALWSNSVPKSYFVLVIQKISSIRVILILV